MSKHIDYEINRELGECYLFMGEFDKAANYYKKAIECETGHAEPFLGLATISVQHGALDDARQNYEAAAYLAPSDKAFAGLGLIALEKGAQTEAFEYFGQALGLNPGNMIALNAMLQLSYKLGRIDEILQYIDSSLSENDNDTIRFTLAGCLSSLGRKDEAKAQLEILLGKDPNNANAQELYAHIAA